MPITSDAVGAYGHIWESLLAGKLAISLPASEAQTLPAAGSAQDNFHHTQLEEDGSAGLFFG